MMKLRMLFSAAFLMSAVVVPMFGMGAAHAQHGADDPCPHRVENLPGCQ